MLLSTTLNDIATGRGYWRYLRKMILPPATAGSGRTFGEGGGLNFWWAGQRSLKKHLYQLSGFSLNFDHLVMRKCRVAFKLVALKISSFHSAFFGGGASSLLQALRAVVLQ